MSDGGKGSKPRPFSVTQQEYDSRWDAIFSRDLPKEEDNILPMPGTIGGAKVVFREDIPVLENEEMWSQRVIDNMRD
jgi:hypothetical protein